MQNAVHFWEEVNEFYQTTGILKMLKQIPADDPVLKETFICSEYLRFDELQKMSRGEPTPAKKPNGRPAQKAGLEEGNKQLAQLTLRFDFLAFSRSVPSAIASKHEFVGVMSKQRSELKSGLKTAVGFVETLRDNSIIEVRDKLLCLLQSIDRFFQGDMQAVTQLHLSQELTALLVLLINNWSLTGLEDESFAVALASNFSTILEVLEATVDRSSLIEAVLLNVYAISDLKGHKRAEEEVKKVNFRSLLKTEKIISKLLESREFADAGAAESPQASHKMIVLQSKSAFSLKVLFCILDGLITCQETVLLKMESIAKLLFGWHLNAVLSLPIAKNPYNELLLLKMLKFVTFLFSKSPYLTQMYGRQVLELVQRSQTRSEVNFKSLLVKSVIFMTLLVEIEELQEQTLVAVKKNQILFLGTAVACILQSSDNEQLANRLFEGIAAKEIVFEDGKVVLLGDMLRTYSETQLRKLLEKISELVVKILQITKKPSNFYNEIANELSLFLSLLSVFKLDTEVLGYQVIVPLSGELTAGRDTILTEQEAGRIERNSLVLSQHLRLQNPYEFNIDDWQSFRDNDGKLNLSDSSKANQLRDSLEKSESSNNENKGRYGERCRRRDLDSNATELSFSNFPAPHATDPDFDQSNRSIIQPANLNAHKNYKNRSPKGSLSHNTSVFDAETDQEIPVDEPQVEVLTGFKRIKIGMLRLQEAPTVKRASSEANPVPVILPTNQAATAEPQDPELNDLPEIDLN